jgi:hypothetical protein
MDTSNTPSPKYRPALPLAAMLVAFAVMAAMAIA